MDLDTHIQADSPELEARELALFDQAWLDEATPPPAARADEALDLPRSFDPLSVAVWLSLATVLSVLWVVVRAIALTA